MLNNKKYLDTIYNYKGEWGIDSQCGLKISSAANGKTVIIATELYDKNPGTSVTQWNTYLATELCIKNGIAPDKLIFIEHTPDKGSKLAFYNETFYKVDFEWDGKKFINPNWEKIPKETVEKLLNG